MAEIVYSRVIGSGPGARTTFQMSDGRTITVKGDRATRNNNPGNMRFGGWMRSQPGFTGIQDGGVNGNGIMSTWATRNAGLAAQARLLFDRYGPNMSIAQAITKYAPPEDNNNTADYIDAAATGAGVPSSTLLGSLSAAQRTSMMRAMHNVEGNTPVRSYDAQGRFRGMIDRNHPPQYQTQPNPGGFDFNNPGGFSPPRPTDAGLAAADYGVSRAKNIRPGPHPALNSALQERGIMRDPSSLPAGTYPGQVVGDGIKPEFAPSTPRPALDRAMQKAGIRTRSPDPTAKVNMVSPTTTRSLTPNLDAAKARAGILSPVATSAGIQRLTQSSVMNPATAPPTTLSPSAMPTRFTPPSQVPARVVQTTPAELVQRVAPVRPPTIAPVRPLPMAPVKAPRLAPIRPAPMPISPVPAPLSQSAFNARANPYTQGLRASDVYAGAIGTARTSTPGTTISRATSFGPTTVTNAWGARTATMPDGKQAAVGSFNPFSGLGENAKRGIGGIAGGVLGSLAGGPVGGLIGSALGRSLAGGGLSGLGSRSSPGQSRGSFSGGGGMAGTGNMSPRSEGSGSSRSASSGGGRGSKKK